MIYMGTNVGEVKTSPTLIVQLFPHFTIIVKIMILTISQKGSKSKFYKNPPKPIALEGFLHCSKIASTPHTNPPNSLGYLLNFPTFIPSYISILFLNSMLKFKNLLLTLIILLALENQGFTQKKPTDYVDVFTGTSNSRWMLFPGPTLPFGMVKLSPDNQDNVWNGGYEYTVGSISGFSHLHAMSLSGLSIMPFVGKVELYPGQAKTFTGSSDGPFAGMWTAGYRSRFDKKTEVGKVGYYGVHLMDSDVKAELTATTRTGWLRFTFPESKSSKIMYNFDFPIEEKTQILEVSVTKVSNQEIEGFIKQKNLYSDEVTVYFVSQMNKPYTKLNGWKTTKYTGNDKNYGTAWRDKQTVIHDINSMNDKDLGGLILDFDTKKGEQIIIKSGISFVSVANARLNLSEENKDNSWNFDKVIYNAEKTWNDLLSTVEITDKNEDNKRKFYTCLYRTYAGKSVMSDVDNSYTDMHEKPQKLKAPADAVYSADSFWGTQWNNTPVWTLLTPKIANSWVNAMLEMYDRGGWIADSPTGFEYAPIMDAQHSKALIVSSYMKGIRNFDVQKAYQAIKHDLTTPDEKPVSGGHAGSRSMKSYMQYGYVPDEDGPTSNTLEYAYDDWVASQMAKVLDKKEDYQYFTKRSENYKNIYDPTTKYMRKKHRDGTFVKDFDPFFFGCVGGWNGSGYMEGNAWLYTFFVPHDVPNLVKMMGNETFNERLEKGFAENHVDMGNQPNLQAPFLFNYSGKPWLTQKYSRMVLDKFYDSTPYKAWQGEEDEGQLSSLFVLMSLGLFEMDGGCAVKPYYDISSPLFEKAVIKLDKTYYGGKTLSIESRNNSSENAYIQSVMFNGVPLNKPIIYHEDLIKGGKLIFTMGKTPNLKWGL
jgi:predicted alpha-1,2-mannosidase